MAVIDDIIRSMSDTPGKANFVHPKFIVIALLPLWYFMNSSIELQVFTAVAITLNTFVRLMFPC